MSLVTSRSAATSLMGRSRSGSKERTPTGECANQTPLPGVPTTHWPSAVGPAHRPRADTRIVGRHRTVSSAPPSGSDRQSWVSVMVVPRPPASGHHHRPVARSTDWHMQSRSGEISRGVLCSHRPGAHRRSGIGANAPTPPQPNPDSGRSCTSRSILEPEAPPEASRLFRRSMEPVRPVCERVSSQGTAQRYRQGLPPGSLSSLRRRCGYGSISEMMSQPMTPSAMARNRAATKTRH